MGVEKKIRAIVRGYEEAIPEKNDASGILAWHRMEHLMAARNTRTPLFVNFGRLAWIAASLVLLAGLSYFNFTSEQTGNVASVSGGIIDHPVPAETDFPALLTRKEPAKSVRPQPFAENPAAQKPYVSKGVVPGLDQPKPTELIQISSVSVSMVSLPTEFPPTLVIGEEMINNKVPKRETGKEKSRLQLAWRPNDKITASKKTALRASPLISVALH